MSISLNSNSIQIAVVSQMWLDEQGVPDGYGDGSFSLKLFEVIRDKFPQSSVRLYHFGNQERECLSALTGRECSTSLKDLQERISRHASSSLVFLGPVLQRPFNTFPGSDNKMTLVPITQYSMSANQHHSFDFNTIQTGLNQNEIGIFLDEDLFHVQQQLIGKPQAIRKGFFQHLQNERLKAHILSHPGSFYLGYSRDFDGIFSFLVLVLKRQQLLNRSRTMVCWPGNRIVREVERGMRDCSKVLNNYFRETLQNGAFS